MYRGEERIKNGMMVLFHFLSVKKSIAMGRTSGQLFEKVVEVLDEGETEVGHDLLQEGVSPFQCV